MTIRTRDIPGLLKQADGIHRASQTGAPEKGLSSFIRLSLDDPTAARRLQSATAHLARIGSTNLTALAILDQALALTSAELGNVQVLAPAKQELRIVAQAGFGQTFLDHFAVVSAGDGSACGRAAAHHAQAVIPDVDADEDYAPHRGVAAASNFRAVQSTPLVDADGHLVGMVSTHFPHPGAPSKRALKLTRIYGLLAGEALARSLARPAQNGAAGRTPVARSAVLELTDTVVRSLLSAGLSLADAQSLIGDGVAGDRVAEAIDELDLALGGIRSAVLELHI